MLKLHKNFSVFLLFLLCAASYVNYSFSACPHVIFTPHFSQKHNNRTSETSRSYFFDKKHGYNNYSLVYEPCFDNYNINDFKDYFAAQGYTESEILSQRCLYIYDEFVRLAQTYSSYKRTIKCIHAALKNLSCWQKVYYIVKGTYCVGLQKRIRYLHDELNSMKLDESHHDDKSMMSRDELSAIFSQMSVEYKTLQLPYQIYSLLLSRAIEKRLNVYSNVFNKNHPLDHTYQRYNLNVSVEQILRKYHHDQAQFIECYGDLLNHTIHQESLDILDHLNNLDFKSILYDHQEVLVDLTVSIVEYNHEGFTDKAMQVADLCWTLLDYGKAVAEGIALGISAATNDILEHPIEATISMVAGRQILAYQLCKVLYNVAGIGLTALNNFDQAKEKWDDYIEPLTSVIDAINKKEITLRDAIKHGTALIVGLRAQVKLLGGLGKFYKSIKQKSINFVTRNSYSKKEKYLTTPEGLLFKASIEQPAQEKIIKLIPSFIKDNRVPLDRETILSSPIFKKTKISSVKGARVYIKNSLFYHRDTLHTGASAHLEVYNKRGIHLGEANIFTGILVPDTADATKKLHL